MRRVLDLFTEQGTVDELGLGTLRDVFSDALFPGTSSIQTRLRYLFFVPWVYKRLAADRVRASDIQDRARKAELALIGPLMDADDDEGVIGAVARGTLKRLPSAVYWSALVRFGIFVPARSQSWLHSRFDRLVGSGSNLPRADDPGVVWTRQATWHPRLPSAPPTFPETASFALTLEEASFLRDQFVARCPVSLFAWLASEGTAPSGRFWDEPALEAAPAGIRAATELARRFSLHVEGAPLVYNLLLAQERHRRQGEEADEEVIESYRARLAKWAADEAEEAPFASTALWSFIATRGGRLVAPQQRFVDGWSKRVSEVGAEGVVDDGATAALIRSREMALKTGRSRFTNRGRLLDWSGEAGVGRMDFRWFRVRQLLTDLHRGLEL